MNNFNSILPNNNISSNNNIISNTQNKILSSNIPNNLSNTITTANVSNIPSNATSIGNISNNPRNPNIKGNFAINQSLPINNVNVSIDPTYPVTNNVSNNPISPINNIGNVSNNVNNPVSNNANVGNNINNRPSSGVLSIKDRMKLLVNNNSEINLPKNNQPIQINHEPKKLINYKGEKDILTNTPKKVEENTKTKEEIEEERRLKREKMKLKMGNSTNKILTKLNAEKDTPKIPTLENEKIKSIANLLQNKINLNPNSKSIYDNDENNTKEKKFARLYENDEDVQYEKEVILEEEDEVMELDKKNTENPIDMDEDKFSKLLEKKPRMMTQVKKFKRPEFKLEN